MTKNQIERKVERLIDAIDKKFMADGNTWTQQEYDAKVYEIDQWASMEYRRADDRSNFREDFLNYR